MPPDLTRLPLTVISGYLGAGKTTLINRILAEDHGLRLLILVNDFGAINIDEGLLDAADDDTIALTNGCVCCTMGADLFMALGDALDRRPRPDHLIIEASGVSDPTKIADAARAEPELRPAGIVSLVDGLAFAEFADDPLIGPQVCTQIAQSDLLVLSKTNDPERTLLDRLKALSPAPLIHFHEPGPLSDIILGVEARGQTRLEAPRDHPAYITWSYEGEQSMDRSAIIEGLASRPPGLLRIKGIIGDPADGSWEVQVAGDNDSVTKTDRVETTRLVAIGLGGRIENADIQRWWEATITSGRR